MASEALLVSLNENERTQLDAKARRLGVTADELVRLAVAAYDVDAMELFFTATADQLETSVEHMNRALDETHEFVQRTLEEMRSERKAAEAERRRAA